MVQGFTTYSEDFVIGDIFRLSKEFTAFYQSDRALIQGVVYWARDVSLPPGIDFRTTRWKREGQSGDITRMVRLRRIPAIQKDAFKIAHELTHLILDDYGFPSLGARYRQFEDLASALSSAFLDPLVDTRLQRYGFSLSKDCRRESDDAFRQTRNSPPPQNQLQRFHWIFNYFGFLLEWKLVKDQIDLTQGEFAQWFKNAYPDIVSEAENLFTLAEHRGFDTPEKLRDILWNVTSSYGLHQVLFL
ncbi:MAG: hypothetical protein U0521_20665 [Anaerolineae bacterium]